MSNSTYATPQAGKNAEKSTANRHTPEENQQLTIHELKQQIRISNASQKGSKVEDTENHQGPDPISYTKPCYQQKLSYSYTNLDS